MGDDVMGVVYAWCSGNGWNASLPVVEQYKARKCRGQPADPPKQQQQGNRGESIHIDTQLVDPAGPAPARADQPRRRALPLEPS